jgi:hypothetical protein
MSTDRELEASANRMAALANRALQMVADTVTTGQEIVAFLANDVLVLAELLPSEQRESEPAAGAIARARRILGPAQPEERH